MFPGIFIKSPHSLRFIFNLPATPSTPPATPDITLHFRSSRLNAQPPQRQLYLLTYLMLFVGVRGNPIRYALSTMLNAALILHQIRRENVRNERRLDVFKNPQTSHPGRSVNRVGLRLEMSTTYSTVFKEETALKHVVLLRFPYYYGQCF